MKSILFLLAVFLFSNLSMAEVDIELTQMSNENKIVVSAVNRSEASNLYIESLSLDIFGVSYVKKVMSNLKPSQKTSVVFYVGYPNIPGTYVQKTTLNYIYDGDKYSLLDVGFFNFKRENGEWLNDRLGNYYINGEEKIGFGSEGFSSEWKFHFPEELSPIYSRHDHAYKLDPTIKNRITEYPIFASIEFDQGGEIYSKIATGRIKVEVLKKKESGRANFFVFMFFIFLIAIYYLFYKNNLDFNVGNYISKLMLISLAYLITNNIIFILDQILDLLLLINTAFFSGYLYENIHDLKGVVNTKFYDENYKYYLQYVADPLLACFILYFTMQMLFFSEHEEEPKYGFLVREISNGRILSLSSNSKMALRACCLKLIFIPFLASWLVQNLVHIHFLYSNFQKVDLLTINKIALGTIFLVDSFIFFQGYCIESSRLKNNILSVDSTKLGWFVCLICYPPLNYYVFTIVDFEETAFSISIPDQMEIILTILITCLWLVFVIASFNLGFKASNLTYRGIVDTGLYKYCRHPAYSSKMIIWLIQALFFGMYYTSFFIALCVVYMLRAYTEEGHLAKNQDYQDYMKKVKYRFIPAVF